MPLVRAVAGVLAAIRWIYFPAAVLAVLALGIHAGADALDDSLLVALDGLDALADAALTAVVSSVWPAFGASPARTEAAVVRVCELVGLEERTRVAQGVAIGLELLADLLIARALLAGGGEGSPVKPLWPPPPPKVLARRLAAWTRGRIERATLRGLATPAMVLALSLAGACAVAQELQSEVFGLARRLAPAGIAGGLSRVVAMVALAAVLLLFAAPAVRHVVPVQQKKPSVRERLAGWRTALLLAPVALAAVLERAPLLSFFR